MNDETRKTLEKAATFHDLEHTVTSDLGRIKLHNEYAAAIRSCLDELDRAHALLDWKAEHASKLAGETARTPRENEPKHMPGRTLC